MRKSVCERKGEVSVRHSGWESVQDSEKIEHKWKKAREQDERQSMCVCVCVCDRILLWCILSVQFYATVCIERKSFDKENWVSAFFEEDNLKKKNWRKGDLKSRDNKAIDWFEEKNYL